MPYRRRSYRRRAPLYRRLPVGGIGFPDQKMIRMRYRVGYTGGPSPSAARGATVFRASSIYDPDYTAGGHQPLGYDQWAPFYDHYIVVSSKLTATVGLNIGQPGRAINFGVFPAHDPTAISSFWPIMESARGGWNTLAGGAYAGGDNQKTASATYSARRFFNIRDVADNVDRLGAAYNDNPTDEAYFVVWYETADQLAANEACALTFTVTIDYLVLLSEPKTLPIS